MVGLVALFHLWFLVLEMFLFTRPTGLETFHLSQQTANACATLAQNQGLYNGFVAVALLLGLWNKSLLLRRYGLGCVMVAGVFGAWSLGDPGPLVGQLVPGLVALLVSELGERGASADGAR